MNILSSKKKSLDAYQFRKTRSKKTASAKNCKGNSIQIWAGFDGMRLL